ncbi:hypothetical protein QTG54_008910 [Skeletonema marinoi]|uniref:Thioesterase domain-containing protein n=1 Tax=Skeletonema marinoi TaxID=267567 RepID=A0AAD8Y867_9STRA|nr:hypothetical protein QTG54_008910 [Skeletonema marinoi]
MGIIHIPRTVAASLRGVVKRKLSPLSDKDISLVGTIDVPHIYTSRAGIFDVDLMGHMNNASYLNHAELARWEWSAFGGSLAQAFKTRSFFIVTASMIGPLIGIPIIRSLYLKPRAASIPLFIATNSAPKTELSTVGCF